MYTINTRKNHKNLTSNVPLKELPDWFQKAETRGAVVHYENFTLKWYKGTWKGGTWEDGIWYDGVWERGKWKKGKWHNGVWEYGKWVRGIWKNGTWYNGIWEFGIWLYGVWYDGYHENGIWKSGIWENGKWENGEWRNGIWIYGIWYNGRWLKGTWKDGFEHSSRCKHYISINYKNKKIKIGNETKTIEEWDNWFNSKDEYDTKRDIEEFKLIYENYLRFKRLLYDIEQIKFKD